MDFQIGESVQLRKDSKVQMNVKCITDKGVVLCVWFSSNLDIKEYEFRKEQLDRWNPVETVTFS